MANRNFSNGGKIFTMHKSPVTVDMSFTVTPTDPTGITNLKGPLVSSILMHSTAATPSKTIAAGTIQVQLQDNFYQIQNVKNATIQAANGTPIKMDNAAMTVGVAYVITTLGDATAAQWQAIGVPAGVTPAVGVAFIAITDGGSANVSTSRVAPTATTSTVATIEVAGNPSLSANPSPTANQGFGAQILLQCRDYAGALVAPATGSVISLEMLILNNQESAAGA